MQRAIHPGDAPVWLSPDRVKQEPGGGAADVVQIVVQAADGNRAFIHRHAPVVMTDHRHILGDTQTVAGEHLDGSPSDHVVETVKCVERDAF